MGRFHVLHQLADGPAADSALWAHLASSPSATRSKQRRGGRLSGWRNAARRGVLGSHPPSGSASERIVRVGLSLGLGGPGSRGRGCRCRRGHSRTQQPRKNPRPAPPSRARMVIDVPVRHARLLPALRTFEAVAQGEPFLARRGDAARLGSNSSLARFGRAVGRRVALKLSVDVLAAVSEMDGLGAEGADDGSVVCSAAQPGVL